jgi:hypothetical protein
MHSEEQTRDDVGLGLPEADLVAACGVIGQVLGRSGCESWSPAEFPIERDREVAVLRAWAAERGLVSGSATEVAWVADERCGEHHLLERGGRIWKATKPHQQRRELQFGFYPQFRGRATGDLGDHFPLVSATPFQYLQRIVLSNKMLVGDSGPLLTRLEGFAEIGGQFSILTSQPKFIHDEPGSTDADLSGWLRGQGYRCVCAGVWYSPAADLALFDIKPSNVILTQGVLVPVDVIPVKPSQGMRLVMEKALR